MTTNTNTNTKQLSDHFTLAEATHSAIALRLGIDNTQPSPDVVEAARNTATNMEVVRTVLGEPIHIDSWIRCLELNSYIGSKITSQHLLGRAVDFICPAFGTPLEICKQLLKYKSIIRFDQLIFEHTWVHISFCSPTDTPRGEVLTLLETGKYAIGLTDKQGNKL